MQSQEIGSATWYSENHLANRARLLRTRTATLIPWQSKIELSVSTHFQSTHLLKNLGAFRARTSLVKIRRDILNDSDIYGASKSRLKVPSSSGTPFSESYNSCCSSRRYTRVPSRSAFYLEIVWEKKKNTGLFPKINTHDGRECISRATNATTPYRQLPPVLCKYWHPRGRCTRVSTLLTTVQLSTNKLTSNDFSKLLCDIYSYHWLLDVIDECTRAHAHAFSHERAQFDRKKIQSDGSRLVKKKKSDNDRIKKERRKEKLDE